MTIETERFTLRPLTQADVSERYLGWFEDREARRNIDYAAKRAGLAELREYVRAREGREDVLFLGIFDRAGGGHIGNIKFEPVDAKRSCAVMGILIGEAEWRGRGVAAEVLDATAAWLGGRGIKSMLLGVARGNAAAIRAYEKAGFSVETTPLLSVDPEKAVTMVRKL